MFSIQTPGYVTYYLKEILVGRGKKGQGVFLHLCFPVAARVSSKTGTERIPQRTVVACPLGKDCSGRLPDFRRAWGLFREYKNQTIKDFIEISDCIYAIIYLHKYITEGFSLSQRIEKLSIPVYKSILCYQKPQLTRLFRQVLLDIKAKWHDLNLRTLNFVWITFLFFEN